MHSRFRHLFKNKALLLALLFGLLSVTGGVAFPQTITVFLNRTNARVLQVFGTYYLVFSFLVVVLSALLMVLPFSRKRLGSGKTEYSRFSWIALLYSTGMGSGLLLRAVQEPVYYYRHPPVSHIDPEQLALQYTFFHWGFTPWAMYSLFGLMVAWRLYIKKKGNIVQAILPGSQSKSGAEITHLFIILITLVGVVASLGLGAGQFIGGLKTVAGCGLGNGGLLLTVSSIGLIATISALTGIQKMIRYLADFDLALSIGLMLFVAALLGGTSSLSPALRAFGSYLMHFPEMSLSIGDYRASQAFTHDWTVFYWAFWLAWVPFTGIFIARISKGRTIREFLFATIIVPAMATMLWFSVFAGKAIALVQQSGSYAGEYDDLFTSIYHFLRQLPLGSITVTVAALLVLIAIINSVDSAIFVLAMFSDHGNPDPAPAHKLSWGIIITVTSLGISALGADALLNAISKLLIIMALPFSILYGWQILCFLYQIINERKK